MRANFKFFGTRLIPEGEGQMPLLPPPLPMRTPMTAFRVVFKLSILPKMKIIKIINLLSRYSISQSFSFF